MSSYVMHHKYHTEGKLTAELPARHSFYTPVWINVVSCYSDVRPSAGVSFPGSVYINMLWYIRNLVHTFVRSHNTWTLSFIGIGDFDLPVSRHKLHHSQKNVIFEIFGESLMCVLYIYSFFFTFSYIFWDQFETWYIHIRYAARHIRVGVW